MSKERVYIVVLNWNGWRDTVLCLESVGRLLIDGFVLGVVVVDNGSMDGSVNEIRKRKYGIRNLEIIENGENLGYAGGNNVGMQYALDKGADWVMVLNNDTRVAKNLIIHLIEAGMKHKDAGALAPKIYFEKGCEFHKKRYKKGEAGKVIWSAGGEIDWQNVFGKNRGVDEVDKGQYDEEAEVDFASGACVLCRAKALVGVGLFDEKYFMYFEDADLAIRMRNKGWKTVYVPEACVWHKVAGSSGIGSGLNDYFIIRNRLYFGMRYASLRAKFALIRESFKIAGMGSEWQKKGAMDFYLGRRGRGSWNDEEG